MNASYILKVNLFGSKNSSLWQETTFSMMHCYILKVRDLIRFRVFSCQVFRSTKPAQVVQYNPRPKKIQAILSEPQKKALCSVLNSFIIQNVQQDKTPNHHNPRMPQQAGTTSFLLGNSSFTSRVPKTSSAIKKAIPTISDHLYD